MKEKHSIKYKNIPSAIRPVSHGEGLSVPFARISMSFQSDERSGKEEEEKDDSAGLQSDLNFDEVKIHSSRQNLITQWELHSLVRDLQLHKNKIGLLGCRLQQWNLLAADVKISKFRDCQQQFNDFFCNGKGFSSLQQY